MAKSKRQLHSKSQEQRNGNGSNSNPFTKKPVYTAIPTTIANRIVRRILFTTGIPAMLGIAVFISNYILVSRQILEIPPGLTLVISGLCFLLALIGLTYGIISTSWEKTPGTRLGFEQVLININRLRQTE